MVYPQDGVSTGVVPGIRLMHAWVPGGLPADMTETTASLKSIDYGL
jgi:hypothetical protein